MTTIVAQLATDGKRKKLAIVANDSRARRCVWLRMKQPQQSGRPGTQALQPIARQDGEGLKQGNRPHYIPDWAASVGMNQADLVRALGADKGSVSKWFSGATPFVRWQRKLADLFGTTAEGLFRHPDEAWLVGFFAGRDRGEVDRIKATLTAAFPKKDESA